MPATVALANNVKHLAGDLVKLETTPKHSSASNPAERAIQAVEEQARTIRADCQMRFGSGEHFGADKPIWAWLLRHAGWQISRYKQKGNGMTAYKQAYGEHYTHEVVPFAEVVLVSVPKPTHRALQGGKRWHKDDAVFIKGVWVGRSETSDEHIVLTPGVRVFSRTIRRLEPSRRHDGKVRPHSSCCLVTRIPVSSPVHNRCKFRFHPPQRKIFRAKNRYVDELHLKDPGHNPTSSELIAKERKDCSTKMEQSRIEETHASQFEIPTTPVYHSKEVILVGERK